MIKNCKPLKQQLKRKPRKESRFLPLQTAGTQTLDSCSKVVNSGKAKKQILILSSEVRHCRDYIASDYRPDERVIGPDIDWPYKPNLRPAFLQLDT